MAASPCIGYTQAQYGRGHLILPLVDHFLSELPVTVVELVQRSGDLDAAGSAGTWLLRSRRATHLCDALRWQRLCSSAFSIPVWYSAAETADTKKREPSSRVFGLAIKTARPLYRQNSVGA